MVRRDAREPPVAIDWNWPSAGTDERQLPGNLMAIGH
jgi:hypothetical protein